MAIREFNPAYIDVYNKSGGWSVKETGDPIRAGGSTEYHTFIAIPQAVKDAIRSSSTPTQLDMRIYISSGSSEIDIGNHRTSSSRVGQSGLPWYAYNETWRDTATGWRTYGMSNWFQPNFLSGNTAGLVLYSAGGQFPVTAYGIRSTSGVKFRVHGTWNTAPNAPSSLSVSTNNDTSATASWPEGTDAEQANSSLTYDIEFYNGSSWSRLASRTTSRTRTVNLTNMSNTTGARFRVRSYDGELYSGWRNSSTFTIKHVPPTFVSSRASYQDTNSTTTAITGNNQVLIQNASTLRVNINTAATANADKTISRYIVSVAGQERTRTSIGSVDFGTINAGNNQTISITAVDSAGLRTTATLTANMIPYQLPDLRYSATRIGTLADETEITLTGTISSVSVGGSQKNSLQTTRYRVQPSNGSYGSWHTFNRSVSGNNFTATPATINLDNTQEWTVHIQVSDKIGTRNVYLTVRSGRPILFLDSELQSVGVHKYPVNNRTFEVEGDMYTEGRLNIIPYGTGNIKSDPIRIFSRDPNGHGYIEYWGSDNNRKGYVGFATSNQNYFEIANEQENSALRLEGSHLVIMNAGLRIHGADAVASGQNANGRWTRYYDGTQVCYLENLSVDGFVSASVLTKRWTFPISFLPDDGQAHGRPVAMVTKNEYSGSQTLRGSSEGALVNKNGDYADVYVMTGTGGISSGWAQGVRVMAIGRWK